MTDLRKLAEAATPGPWIGNDESDYGLARVIGCEKQSFRLIADNCDDEDARYIAAANPQAILELLDKLDKALEQPNDIPT